MSHSPKHYPQLGPGPGAHLSCSCGADLGQVHDKSHRVGGAAAIHAAWEAHIGSIGGEAPRSIAYYKELDSDPV